MCFVLWGRLLRGVGPVCVWEVLPCVLCPCSSLVVRLLCVLRAGWVFRALPFLLCLLAFVVVLPVFLLFALGSLALLPVLRFLVAWLAGLAWAFVLLRARLTEVSCVVGAAPLWGCPFFLPGGVLCLVRFLSLLLLLPLFVLVSLPSAPPASSLSAVVVPIGLSPPAVPCFLPRAWSLTLWRPAPWPRPASPASWVSLGLPRARLIEPCGSVGLPSGGPVPLFYAPPPRGGTLAAAQGSIALAIQPGVQLVLYYTPAKWYTGVHMSSIGIPTVAVHMMSILLLDHKGCMTDV